MGVGSAAGSGTETTGSFSFGSSGFISSTFGSPSVSEGFSGSSVALGASVLAGSSEGVGFPLVTEATDSAFSVGLASSVLGVSAVVGEALLSSTF